MTLCNPMDHSPPGSSVHGIFQVRILEWVAIFFSRESSETGIEPISPALVGGFFTIEHQGSSDKGISDFNTMERKLTT